MKQEYDLSPDEPKALGPVLGLLYRTFKSGLAYKDGTLVVKFAEGRKIVVLSDPNCEAWNVVGTRGLRVVCMPGGDWAVWQPDPA
jgi:hypothetical protein